MPETTHGLMIVVAQDEPGVYSNLCRRFRGIDRVRIVRDRRLGDRRRRSTPRDGNRRIADRRVQPPTTSRLTDLGYAMVFLPDVAKSGGPPADG